MRWSKNRFSSTTILSGLVLAMMGIQFMTGLIGIDYGEHWDEFKQILLVKYTIREGNIAHG